MFRQFDQFRRWDAILLVGVMRMGADRAVDIWKPLDDFKQSIEPTHPRRDRDDAPDPGTFSARDDAVEIVGKVREIQVAMAVDKHGVPTGQVAIGST